MRTFAIGDIHGESGALQTLINLQIFTENDTIIFLGDYVDKGPDVKGVITSLLKFSEQFKSIFLMGNHEIMMINARSNQQLLTSWLMNGGAQTLDSYHIGDDLNWHQKIPGSHWTFLKNGFPYFEKDEFIFVHAGLQPGIMPEDQNQHHLYWQKYLTPAPYAPDKTVICGHTSRKNGKIADFGHTICIDTFAWGGQWLTCLEVESGRYWQTRKNGEFREGSLR